MCAITLSLHVCIVALQMFCIIHFRFLLQYPSENDYMEVRALTYLEIKSHSSVSVCVCVCVCVCAFGVWWCYYMYVTWRAPLKSGACVLVHVHVHVHVVHVVHVVQLCILEILPLYSCPRRQAQMILSCTSTMCVYS